MIRKKLIQKWLILAAIVSVVTTAIYLLPYFIILEGPQKAVFKEQPFVNKATLVTDSKTVNFEDGKLFINYPKPLLSGFRAIASYFQKDNEQLNIGLSMNEIWGIYNNKSTTEIPIRTVYYDDGNSAFYYNESHTEKCKERSNVSISKLKIKKIRGGRRNLNIDLETSFEVTLFSTPYDCLGSEQRININDFTISIESDVLYQWTGKGGPTYEL